MTSTKENALDSAINKKSLFPLMAIISCALVPLVSATALFFWPPESFSFETKHHGQLVSPPLPINDNELNTYQLNDNEALSSPEGLKKWRLAQIQVQQNCHTKATDSPDSSMSPIKTQHQQIVSALGRESHRVTNVELCIPVERYSQWQNKLSEQNDQTVQSSLSGIIDPQNKLIMVYPKDTPQRGIFKDLKRLLKYSKLG